MKVRYEVPVWALLFCVPVALLAINCGTADLGAKNDQFVTTSDFNDELVSAKEMDMSSDADEMMMSDDTALNLDEGASDEWRRRRWWRRGYYPYWRGYYGYGYGWPYYNYGYRWWW